MPDPYISEIKFLGAGNQDFVEIAVDEGSDTSGLQLIVYHPNGTVRTTNDLDAPSGTMAGRDIFTIDAAGSDTFNGVHKNGAVALVKDGVVQQFLSFEQAVTATEGPADGMTSTELGGTGSGESLETRDRGATYDTQDTPTRDTIPCFLSGTQIDTDTGLRAIETLKVGDLVKTQGGAFHPIQWIGTRQLTLSESAEDTKHPIRIPPHAFGPQQPFCETYVSPNHRIAISGPAVELLFAERTVFVAAKFLIGHHGIGHAPVALPIQFFHILLDAHHVISANGLRAESLFHGAVAADGFAHESYPDAAPLAAFTPHSQAGHRVLKAAEARLLARSNIYDRPPIAHQA